MPYALDVAVVELTHLCNLGCLHCGSRCSSFSPGDRTELSIEEWKGFLDQFQGLSGSKIIYSGGEPTLKSGFDKLIADTASRGLNYGFITNGYHLPLMVQKAMRANPPFAVGVSIDGLKQTHNTIRRNDQSWQKAFLTVERLKDLGIEVCISTTINKLNYNELDKLAFILDTVKADSWQIILGMPSGRMRDNSGLLVDENIFKQSAAKIVKLRLQYPEINIQAADCFGPAAYGLIRPGNWGCCQAGISMIGMNAFGDVLPCLSLWGGVSAGNLKEQSLQSIWNDSPAFDFNRKFDSSNVTVGRCVGCQWLEKCKGGCASQSMSYNGHYHDAPFCYTRSFSPSKNPFPD